MYNLKLTYHFYITLQNNFWMVKMVKMFEKEELMLFCLFSIFNPFIAFFNPSEKSTHFTEI